MMDVVDMLLASGYVLWKEYCAADNCHVGIDAEGNEWRICPSNVDPWHSIHLKNGPKKTQIRYAMPDELLKYNPTVSKK